MFLLSKAYSTLVVLFIVIKCDSDHDNNKSILLNSAMKLPSNLK